jgi:hypothetical protein
LIEAVITKLSVNPGEKDEAGDFVNELIAVRATGFEAVSDTITELYTKETLLDKTMNSLFCAFACAKSEKRLEQPCFLNRR